MFLQNLQEQVVHVEAYLRSVAMNREDSVGRWILATTPSSTQESQPVSGTSSLSYLLT